MATVRRNRCALALENVHHLGAPGEVTHAVGAAGILHTMLLDSFAEGGHRFEVAGLIASLDFIELIGDIVLGVLGKIPKAFRRIAQEAHRPHQPLNAENENRNLVGAPTGN